MKNRRTGTRTGSISRASTVLIIIVLIIITGAAMASLSRLQLSDDHQLLLKSSAEEYSGYQKFKKSFPREQQDLIVVLAGELWTNDGIQQLKSATVALLALSSVQGVASVLDVPWVDKQVRALPQDDATVLAAVKEKLSKPDYLPSRFVADDFKTNTFTITLTPAAVNSRQLLESANSEIRQVLGAGFADDLSWKLAGYPALRIALIEQIKRDSLVYSSLAFFFAAVVAFTFLRSVKLVAVSLLAPLLAVIWTLSLLATFGISINSLNQMVIVMVLVITYADSMHVLVYLRQANHTGLAKNQLAGHAMKIVLPACLMTSVTTGVGFASLVVSESYLVKQFGMVCALGALVGFVAIAICTPLMARWVTSDNTDERRLVSPKSFGFAEKRDRVVLALGLLLTTLLLLIAVQLRPGYQLGENLPSDHEFSRATKLADDQLGGVLPLHMMVEWQTDIDVSDRQKLRDIRKIRRLLNESTELEWLSVVDLLKFSSGFNSVSRLQLLPDQVVGRLLNRSDARALLTAQLPVADSDQFNVLFARLNNVALNITEQVSGVEIKLNGLLPLLNSTSQSMIGDLIKSLATTFMVVSLMMWIVFRSWRLALLLIIPNIAPIAGVAAVLVCFNQPLRYASVIVFSICLGIVIDDSIHIAHRYLLYRRSGIGQPEAIARTMNEVGFVLILTTTILIGGFTALVFGSNPTVSVIGLLLIAGLCFALIYDLLVLPALLRRFHQ